jgi:hypothetical protein
MRENGPCGDTSDGYSAETTALSHDNLRPKVSNVVSSATTFALTVSVTVPPGATVPLEMLMLDPSVAAAVSAPTRRARPTAMPPAQIPTRVRGVILCVRFELPSLIE